MFFNWIEIFSHQMSGSSGLSTEKTANKWLWTKGEKNSVCLVGVKMNCDFILNAGLE